jgi:hypothetical protein
MVSPSHLRRAEVFSVTRRRTQVEADSHQHAFSFLQKGAVVHTMENTD